MRRKAFVAAIVWASVLLVWAIGSAQTPAGSLPRLAAGESLGQALGIATVPNLRDLGGYSTKDGASVARGRVYRSDTFNPMSAGDLKKLALLGLKNDFDLRTAAEAKAQPDQMPPGVRYHFLDVLADSNLAAPANLDALMLYEPKKANQELGGGKVEALYIGAYREFITLPSAKRSYAALFRSLADRRNQPAVFHCTTGKDRTGWAAAALLTLLGVPQETVLADYLRANRYIIPQYQKAIDAFSAAGGEKSIALAYYGVKPEYLQASFNEMRKQYGSIEKYFSEGLGVGPAEQKALRESLLIKK